MTMAGRSLFLSAFWVTAVMFTLVKSSSVPCLESAEDLQAAIMALPLDNVKYGTPEILLCANVVVELSRPLIIRDRSVRLGCSEVNTEEGEPLCTLRASEGIETRLMDIRVTKRRKISPTVHLSQIRFENGESYDQDNQAGLGGAVLANGYSLILEDCRFNSNVASQKGGAVSVSDNGSPILFLVTRTIFQENLSIDQGDCHSIYFHQDHPASMAELNTETDFSASKNSGTTHGDRQLLEYWDDPANAASSLRDYRPGKGVFLCF